MKGIRQIPLEEQRNVWVVKLSCEVQILAHIGDLKVGQYEMEQR